MVEGAALEKRCGLTLTGGSNPSPSDFSFRTAEGFEAFLAHPVDEKARQRRQPERPALEAAVAAGKGIPLPPIFHLEQQRDSKPFWRIQPNPISYEMAPMGRTSLKATNFFLSSSHNAKRKQCRLDLMVRRVTF